MITCTSYKLFVSLNMFPCQLIGEKEKFRTFQGMLVLENHNLSDKHKGKKHTNFSQTVSFFNSIVEVFYIQVEVFYNSGVSAL